MADLTKYSPITGRARTALAATLARNYENGASIRALAESTGRSYGFIHRLLTESGVALRAHGGATRTTTKRPGQPSGQQAQ
jgi:Helix-turn-helix domain